MNINDIIDLTAGLSLSFISLGGIKYLISK